MSSPRSQDIELGQSIVAGDLLLPRLVVRQTALERNIDRMARFCRDSEVWLAPHAKTTMAPGILRRQLEAGVWGFTVATVVQAQTLRSLGVERLLIANQVVEPRAITWLADEMSRDDEFEAIVLVDSVRGVSILDSSLATLKPSRPLEVLIELAEAGGRSGCRTDEEALRVADAIRSAPHLQLVGVEGFEAMVPASQTDAFLQRLRGLIERLDRDGHFGGLAEVIVSAGTSETFEKAAEQLSGWEIGRPVRTLLRPGGYATYKIGPDYLPVLEIWAAVLSKPEPGRVIAGFGRRDVPSDASFVTPTAAASNGVVRAVKAGVKVARLMDQHAIIEAGDAEVEVADLIGCSIDNEFRPSFATWRQVPVVDDEYSVVEVLEILY